MTRFPTQIPPPCIPPRPPLRARLPPRRPQSAVVAAQRRENEALLGARATTMVVKHTRRSIQQAYLGFRSYFFPSCVLFFNFFVRLRLAGVQACMISREHTMAFIPWEWNSTFRRVVSSFLLPSQLTLTPRNACSLFK